MTETEKSHDGISRDLIEVLMTDAEGSHADHAEN